MANKKLSPYININFAMENLRIGHFSVVFYSEKTNPNFFICLILH